MPGLQAKAPGKSNTKPWQNPFGQRPDLIGWLLLQRFLFFVFLPDQLFNSVVYHFLPYLKSTESFTNAFSV